MFRPLLLVVALLATGCGAAPRLAAPTAPTVIRAKLADPVAQAAITKRFTGTQHMHLINGEQTTISTISDLTLSPSIISGRTFYTLTQHQTVIRDIIDLPAPITSHRTTRYRGQYDASTGELTIERVGDGKE